MALSPQFGSIIPSQAQQILASNYLQFNTGAGADFAQQYLPEIYEQEVERYGNRTLSGFLKMVGAEMPMTSDQVIWSEQNRLHISYNACTQANGAGTSSVIQISPLLATAQNVISVNDTVVVLDPATGAEAKALVTASTPGAGGGVGQFTVTPFNNASLEAAANGITVGAGIKVFVYGSEYGKGSLTPNNTAVTTKALLLLSRNLTILQSLLETNTLYLDLTLHKLDGLKLLLKTELVDIYGI